MKINPFLFRFLSFFCLAQIAMEASSDQFCPSIRVLLLNNRTRVTLNGSVVIICDAAGKFLVNVNGPFVISSNFHEILVNHRATGRKALRFLDEWCDEYLMRMAEPVGKNAVELVALSDRLPAR